MLNTRSIFSYLPEFEHYLKFEKRYSQHTIVAYKKDIQQFIAFISPMLDHVSKDDIAKLHLQVRLWMSFLKSEAINPRSINRKVSSLSAYFKFLMIQGIVLDNPTDKVIPLKIPKRIPQFLREQETIQLFQEIPESYDLKTATTQLILELLYACGIRRAELKNIRIEDVDFYGKQIRVKGKGNKDRIIPVADAILSLIQKYVSYKGDAGLERSGILLVLENGVILYDNYIYRIVKSYLTQVSSLKKKSPHILRHTFATHLLNNGASIQAIKELLGHSSIAATQIYTHINIEELKKIHKLNHPRG
jgi:integrase/recombinase XerC